jgi:hypothetical protein
MEIDIAVANERKARWMQLLPPVFLVECKNWDAKVDSGAVSKFGAKLRYRRIDTGILVAANGITGDSNELSSAYQIVAFEQPPAASRPAQIQIATPETGQEPHRVGVAYLTRPLPPLA